jgi:hypothetical protein
MIRSFCLLLLLAFGPTLRAQQLAPRATAQRAVDFATWRHSERVLREKMALLCTKPDPLPKEKAWCLIWSDGLETQLTAVREVDQTPSVATLDSLLLPFSATRAEAAAFHAALTNRLGRGDSLAVDETLRHLRGYLIGPDSTLLLPIARFFGTSEAVLPVAEVAAVPPVPAAVPEAAVQPDAVVPTSDATPWKIGTLAVGLLALLGWGYALTQRRQVRLWREKTERLQRDWHEHRSNAWFGQLSTLRNRDGESTPHPA